MLTRSKPMRPRRGFEILERRLMLDGTVTVSLSATGLLSITGDAQNNTVVVEQIDQNYVISSPTNDTIVYQNNTPGEIPIGQVRNIRVDLRDGDDLFAFGGMGSDAPQSEVRGSLTVRMGNGADRVDINAALIRNSLTIDTGRGSDAVVVTNSTVQRNLDLSTGLAVDLVFLGGVTVFNNARVDTAGSNDFVNTLGLLAGNRLDVQTGSGDDTFLASRYTEDTTDTTAATIVEQLNTFLTDSGATGAFSDLAEYFAPGGFLEARLDEVAANTTGSFYAWNAVISTGDGNDTAMVNDADVSRCLQVRLGAGDDDLTFLRNAYGDANLDGGPGTDSVTFNPEGLNGNEPRLRRFEDEIPVYLL